MEDMKLSVLGGIFHMCATDDNPVHKYCPDGEFSWCRHKRAIAKGEKPPPHKPTYKREIVPTIFPLIKRLTEPELLQRCSKMLTQNANESFNSTVWNRCPKTVYRCKSSVETAVALATLSFNCGPAGIVRVMDILKIKKSGRFIKHVQIQTKDAIGRARKKCKGISKWRRKSMKLRDAKKDHERKEIEGVTYESAQFSLEGVASTSGSSQQF